jgi:hypothetical protein
LPPQSFSLNFGGIVGGLLGLAALITVVFVTDMPSCGFITFLAVAGAATIGNRLWDLAGGETK